MKYPIKIHGGSLTIIAFALIAMLFVGCQSPLSGNQAAIQGGNPALGTVRLTIGQGLPGSRTIYPTTPTFTKYVFTFTPLDSQNPHSPLEITDPSATIELEPGAWEITAFGYALFNSSEVIVAESEVLPLTVTAGVSINFNIDIRSSIGGVAGKFAYQLEVPQGLPATDYQLTLQLFGESPLLINASGLVDTASSAFSDTNSGDFAPGFYLATARVNFAHDATAVKTEIVHIYSNMTSQADFSFTADDFMPVIELIGALSVTINDIVQDVQGWQISAYTSSDYNGPEIAYTHTEAGGAWSMLVEPQAAGTILYFKVWGSGWYDLDIPVSLAVSNADISGIALTYNGTRIELSGSLEVTIDGAIQHKDNWGVIACTDPNHPDSTRLGYADTDAGSAWSMLVEPPASSTPVYFRISGRDDSDHFIRATIPGSTMVGSVAVSGIALIYDVDMIQLSGTLSITIDGAGQSIVDAQIAAITDLGNVNGSYVISADVNSDGTWSMTIPAYATATDMYFLVETQTGFYHDETPISVHNINLNDIALDFDISTVQVSGTLVGFTPVFIGACLDPTTGGSAQLSIVGMAMSPGTDWALAVNVAMLPADVYFIIQNEENLYVSKDTVYIAATGASGIVLNSSNMDLWNPSE